MPIAISVLCVLCVLFAICVHFKAEHVQKTIESGFMGCEECNQWRVYKYMKIVDKKLVCHSCRKDILND